MAMLFCVAMLSALTGTCQTFSVRSSSTLTSLHFDVLNQDYGYLVVGLGYDSLQGFLSNGMQVRGYDFTGQVLYEKFYNSPDWLLHPSSDINARLNDSTVIIGATEFRDGNDTIFNTLVWMNNIGDTIKTRRYHSPYYNDNIEETHHFVPTCVVASDNGQSIYLTSQAINVSGNNTFIIKKLTAFGDEVWTYLNDSDMWYYSSNAAQFFEDQLWVVVIASGQSDNYDKLIRLNDANGEIDFEVEHNGDPFPLGGAGEMVMDEQG